MDPFSPAASSQIRKLMIFFMMLPALGVFADSKHSRRVSTETCSVEDKTCTERGIVPPIPVWDTYEVLETIPHDTKAFTQGLTLFNDRLFESIGHYGRSELREINPTTGEVISSTPLEDKYFGEGLTYFKDKSGKDLFIQLTWLEKTGFIYDANTLEVVKTFKFATDTREGWGITYDPRKHLFIVSDGSDYLYFWDAETLEEVRRINVVLNNKGNRIPMKNINELEFVNGKVMANLWYRNIIVTINPENGVVERMIDFKDLYRKRDPTADCFNGIAPTDVENEFFVTGKFWPNMYRILVY